eukprot:865083-Amphidinium_carterae.1
MLGIGQMAAARSILTACRLAELTQALRSESAVVVAAGNGVVGQILSQLLAQRKLWVYAVVRWHGTASKLALALQRSERIKVVWISHPKGASIRQQIDDMQLPRPTISFDCVGGSCSEQIAASLTGTADIIRFGEVSGDRKVVLPSARAAVQTFSLAEWLSEDRSTRAQILLNDLRTISEQISARELFLEVMEYNLSKVITAVSDFKRSGRTHAVALRFNEAETTQLAHSKESFAVELDCSRPEQALSCSWDMPFFAWEEEEEVRCQQRCLTSDIFQQLQQDPGVGSDKLIA